MSENQKYPHLVDFPGFKVGWTRGADDDPVVIANPNVGGSGCYIRHTLLVNADGSLGYDTVSKLEKGGAVTVVIRPDTDQVGLLDVWRAIVPQSEMPKWSASWPNVSVQSLGFLGKEFPRGFPQAEDATVEDTAKRETEEETGTAVVSTEFLGFISGNTTFEAQLTAVFLATVDPKRIGRYKKDPNEKILRVDWYGRRDLVRLKERGELVCGFTLAALQTLDLIKPGMLR